MPASFPATRVCRLSIAMIAKFFQPFGRSSAATDVFELDPRT
jgi:hypothetical protein